MSFDIVAAAGAVKEVESIFRYMGGTIKSLVCKDLFSRLRGKELYPTISNNEEFSGLIFYSLEKKCISEFQRESGFSASDCADEILDKMDNLYRYLTDKNAPDKQSDLWASLTKPFRDECNKKHALTTESSNQESEDLNALIYLFFGAALVLGGAVCYYCCNKKHGAYNAANVDDTLEHETDKSTIGNQVLDAIPTTIVVDDGCQ